MNAVLMSHIVSSLQLDFLLKESLLWKVTYKVVYYKDNISNLSQTQRRI